MLTLFYYTIYKAENQHIIKQDVRIHSRIQRTRKILTEVRDKNFQNEQKRAFLYPTTVIMSVQVPASQIHFVLKRDLSQASKLMGRPSSKLNHGTLLEAGAGQVPVLPKPWQPYPSITTFVMTQLQWFITNLCRDAQVKKAPCMPVLELTLTKLRWHECRHHFPPPAPLIPTFSYFWKVWQLYPGYRTWNSKSLQAHMWLGNLSKSFYTVTLEGTHQLNVKVA